MSHKKKILIFNFNWLGDILFTTPAIRAIHEHFPGASISCIVPDSYQEILKGNPFIEELITFKNLSLAGKIKLFFSIKKRGFDLCFLFHRSRSRALMCYLAGIPQIIGYETKRRGRFLTQRFPPPLKDSLHKADYVLNLINQAGIKTPFRQYEFFSLTPPVFPISSPYVVFNPGGNWEPKRWPKNYFIELGKRLVKKYNIVLTGTIKDQRLIEEIKNGIGKKAFSLCGQTSLGELAYLMKKANWVLGGDTGPIHLGAAAGAKVLILFGPTSPQLTGPLSGQASVLKGDSKCPLPCYELNCQDYQCMKAITPEDVLNKLEELNLL